MPVEITATIDPKQFAAFATLKGNVRIAAAIGLTKSAKAAQAALKDEAGSIFHLRNRWVPGGIRIEPATAATLIAKVGSIDKYMSRHVEGTKKDAGQRLSIGSRGSDGRIATGGLLIGLYAGIDSAKTHTQERRMLNRIDVQKKKTFQILGSGGRVLIVRRTGKGRDSLQFLAVLKNNVPEKAVWNMQATVSVVVAARFTEYFAAAINFKKNAK